MNYQPTSGGVLVPMQPLAPYDDRAADASRDFAATGKFSMYALERMLRDCTDQPEWRLRAKLCAAYYDGKQLDEVRRWLLQEEGLDERVINLIRPIINSVLGQEARSRTDIRIEADDDNFADVAEVISNRLKEAERETYAHQSVSDGYASMVKKGLGWVHVCRNADPLAYPYRVEEVPVDEIWWDWKGQRGTKLDDRCRWLARMRMIDLDEIIASMPQHKEVLERTAAGWDDPRMDTSHMLGEPEDMQLTSAYENERRFNTMYRKWDWIDSARRMIKVIEVWYRVPATAVVLVLSPTRRVPYNPKDPRHVEAVSRGLVKIIKGPTSQVRRALYAGPHRLLDEATTRKRFPYVPLFAYRDDADGSPYGMVDGMIAPQDDYNDRRHRIQWMLKARQLFIDNDAVDEKYNTIDEIAANVNRPDLVAVLKGNRKQKNGVRIENTLALQSEQFVLLEGAEQLVQKAAGRYGSSLGDAQVQSGVANQLLVEQGEQAMGEMNDNYTYGRRTVFENLTDLIVEDHLAPDLKAHVGKGKTRRVVVLNTWVSKPQTDPATGEPLLAQALDPRTNQPAVDEAGQPVTQPVMGAPEPENMVADAEIRTGMAETPNTPAYRQQTQQQLKEIIAALGNNPQALAVVAPAYIESTSADNRHEMADDLRRLSGLPPAGDRKGREAAEKLQAQALQDAQAMEKSKVVAEVADKTASAELKTANARKINAEAERLERGILAGGPEAEVAGQQAKNQAAAAAANDDSAAVDAAVQDALAV